MVGAQIVSTHVVLATYCILTRTKPSTDDEICPNVMLSGNRAGETAPAYDRHYSIMFADHSAKAELVTVIILKAGYMKTGIRSRKSMFPPRPPMKIMGLASTCDFCICGVLPARLGI
jgi:hypothetical protein